MSTDYNQSASAREPGEVFSRATRSISLALIGSSLILAGCGRAVTEKNEECKTPDGKPTNCAGSRSGSHSRSRGVFIPFPGGRGGYYRSTPTPGGRSGVGTTTRGGFGSSGHSAVGG